MVRWLPARSESTTCAPGITLLLGSRTVPERMPAPLDALGIEWFCAESSETTAKLGASGRLAADAVVTLGCWARACGAGQASVSVNTATTQWNHLRWNSAR